MSPSVRMEIAPFKALAPEVFDALSALSQSAGVAGLEKDLIELVKIRASQINGCAYCVQYHVNLARALGVEAGKLDQLAVWREALVYTPRERAALALTERLVLIAGHEVSDAEFAAAQAEFGEKPLAYLLGAIGVINTWNRIAITYRFRAPPASRAR